MLYKLFISENLLKKQSNNDFEIKIDKLRLWISELWQKRILMNRKLSFVFVIKVSSMMVFDVNILANITWEKY